MPGQWVERPDGRWDWDESAPDRDDSPTRIGPPVTATPEIGQEPAMTQLEPADTGPARTTPPAPVYDTAEPATDGDVHLPQSMAGLDGTQLAVCPTCGTGVAADRLRKL